MHVHTLTALTKEEIEDRFKKIGEPADDQRSGHSLTYQHQRQPPKLFLRASPLSLPAAAEVAINDDTSGAEVVLRLMWGPLPAPFPRCLAIAGVILGILIVAIMEITPVVGLFAAAVIIAPSLALYLQKNGEENLKAALASLLDGATFIAKPH